MGLGFMRDLLLKLVGKKMIIGYIGAGMIALASWIFGVDVDYIREAIQEAPKIEVPEVLKEGSPLEKQDEKKPEKAKSDEDFG